MKNPRHSSFRAPGISRFSLLKRFSPAIIASLSALACSDSQALLYFDSNGTSSGFGNPGSGTWGIWNTTNTNWYGGDFTNVGDYDGTGAPATFSSALGNTSKAVVVFNRESAGASAVNLGASFNDLGGLYVVGSNASALTFTGVSGVRTLTFASGAEVNIATGNTLTFSASALVAGNFSLKGGGTLSLISQAAGNDFVGTATVSAGTFSVGAVSRVSTNSNFVMENGGSVFLAVGSDVTYNVGNISGVGGDIRAGNSGSASTKVLNINQTQDGTYGGTFSEASLASKRLKIQKNGTAKLTLSGNITATAGLSVDAGKLLINSTTTDFRSLTTTAVAVNNGGTLGGTGVIKSTGFDAVLSAGGKLAPGGDTTAGHLTFDPGASNALDISAGVTADNTGALAFRLGSVALSDSITLATGALKIGTGVLKWDDFSFTALSGLAAGDYILFDTSSSINGTFGDTLTGSINAMYNGQLKFSSDNQDIILSVVAVPEPATWAMMIGGLGMLSVFGRHRRQRAE